MTSITAQLVVDKKERTLLKDFYNRHHKVDKGYGMYAKLACFGTTSQNRCVHNSLSTSDLESSLSVL